MTKSLSGPWFTERHGTLPLLQFKLEDLIAKVFEVVPLRLYLGFSCSIKDKKLIGFKSQVLSPSSLVLGGEGHLARSFFPPRVFFAG